MPSLTFFQVAPFESRNPYHEVAQDVDDLINVLDCGARDLCDCSYCEIILDGEKS